MKNVWNTPLVSDRRDWDAEGVGSVRIEGGHAFRWVENTHTSALTLGDVVFHDLDDAGATLVTEVSRCATADLFLMAGVVMATDGLAAYSSSAKTMRYGWIQIFGYNADINAYASGGTAIVAGDSLKGVNDALYVVHDQNPGVAPIYQRKIMAIEGLASSVTVATTIKGFVHCI